MKALLAALLVMGMASVVVAKDKKAKHAAPTDKKEMKKDAPVEGQPAEGQTH